MLSFGFFFVVVYFVNILVDHLTEDLVRQNLGAFVGNIEQEPPL